MKKVVNGIEVEMTPEEEEQFLAEQPVPVEGASPSEINPLIVIPERDYGAEIDALEARVTALENKVST